MQITLRTILLLTLFSLAPLASGDEAMWRTEWPNTDFSRTTVDLGEFISGGPPKDGIPSIDHPVFETTTTASTWLDPAEPVITLVVDGQARAYPLQILIYHEIVNDEVAGFPLAVTFCPLCNAAVVFERRVDGEVLDFGTTGKLRRSDLVMYDRQSESWWQQITGSGIVGRYAGTDLKRRPATIVAYRDFREAWPEGKVLSRKTGQSRPYGNNPYRGYDNIDQNPFLLKDDPDPRLPAMERVISVVLGGKQRIYPFSVFNKQPVINDELAGTALVIFSQHGTLSALDQSAIKASRLINSATVFDRQIDDRLFTFEKRGDGFYDQETGSRWNLLGQAVTGPLKGKSLEPLVGSGEHFAFAWLAFNPEAEIFRLE